MLLPVYSKWFANETCHVVDCLLSLEVIRWRKIIVFAVSITEEHMTQ